MTRAPALALRQLLEVGDQPAQPLANRDVLGQVRCRASTARGRAPPPAVVAAAVRPTRCERSGKATASARSAAAPPAAPAAPSPSCSAARPVRPASLRRSPGRSGRGPGGSDGRSPRSARSSPAVARSARRSSERRRVAPIRPRIPPGTAASLTGGLRSHRFPSVQGRAVSLISSTDRWAFCQRRPDDSGTGQPGLEPGIAGFGDRCLSQLGHCPEASDRSRAASARSGNAGGGI